MSAENETLADIVAEMRGTDNKCQLATKDGTGCYHCPFGSAASNCLFDKFADRIEAAHKREVEKLNSVIQATVSRSDAEIDRLRREVAELRKQIGNAAAMREALESALIVVRGIIDGTLSRRNQSVFDCRDKLKSALAAPPRNCDKYTSLDEARNAYMAINEMPEGNRDEDMRQWLCDFHHWFFALAKEGGAK